MTHTAVTKPVSDSVACYLSYRLLLISLIFRHTGNKALDKTGCQIKSVYLTPNYLYITVFTLNIETP